MQGGWGEGLDDDGNIPAGGGSYAGMINTDLFSLFSSFLLLHSYSCYIRVFFHTWLSWCVEWYPYGDFTTLYKDNSGGYSFTDSGANEGGYIIHCYYTDFTGYLT